MKWETEYPFNGKLCQEYSYQKLPKSANRFLSYSQKVGDVFLETQCRYRSAEINAGTTDVNLGAGVRSHIFEHVVKYLVSPR